MFHQCVRNGYPFSQCSNNSFETCNCPTPLAFGNMYFENTNWLTIRISKLLQNLSDFQNFKQSTGKVLQNADVKACLSDLYSKYVFVPTVKASKNLFIILDNITSYKTITILSVPSVCKEWLPLFPMLQQFM